MNKIRERRLEAGMTQSDLAVKSGISRATICMLEKNPAQNTSTRTLYAIARALNTTVDRIFYDE